MYESALRNPWCTWNHPSLGYWKNTLAVEISYSLEGHDIHFDLLLLFTEDSVELLSRKLALEMN